MAAERAERDQLPEIGHQARAKATVAKYLLAGRERSAATAARIWPPYCITDEFGQRPSDPVKGGQRDKAVREIVGYRVRNGVKDRKRALGPEQKEPAPAKSSGEPGKRSSERSGGFSGSSSTPPSAQSIMGSGDG